MELAVALLALLSLAAVGLAVLSRRGAARAEHHASELEARDLLTGLPVRRVLVEQLEARLPSASRSTPVTLMLIELNRFAAINETYGHEIGDALLASITKRLEAATRPAELLVRYAGPQLALLGVSGEVDEVQRRAAELLSVFDAPVRLGTDNIRVSASIGVVRVDNPTTTVDAALADAGAALRQAVTDGPNRIAVFELAMRSRLAPALAEAQLRDALEQDRFWLFYLPVVELGTNKLVGTEALLRWADPTEGFAEPGQFLDVLEESGLIVPVGLWALRTACQQAVDWKARFPGTSLTMTVNVSPRQLLQSDFCDGLATVISETGIAPEELCLEVAGGESVYDLDSVRQSMRDAKDLGVQLALDDFGVGFASLDFVRRFEIDVLKVERALVGRLTDSREDLAIVQQLVGLGQALDITTVAEGVDTAAQAEALVAMNCDFAQGYHWMRPQPPKAMDAVIQRGRILPGQDTAAPAVDWSGTA